MSLKKKTILKRFVLITATASGWSLTVSFACMRRTREYLKERAYLESSLSALRWGNSHPK